MTNKKTLLGVFIAGSIALATAGGATGVFAQTAFSAPDRTFDGSVRFASAVRGQPLYAGQAVVITGEGFKAGQTVTLMHGATALDTGPLTAGQDGKFEARITLPTEAAVGVHPIIVTAQGPYAATVVDLKVSPNIPLSGADAYTVQTQSLTPGLYQSAYSARNNAVFVTSATGRPPVRVSELLRLDGDSLAITARVTPGAAPAREPRPGAAAGSTDAGVYAVYGVGVDDLNNNVWVTNTRQNTVAVYSQADLSLVKQFEPGTVNHARDILIDHNRNKAYASATFAPEVVAFDARTLEVVARVAIQSGVRGETFSAASLDFDAANGKIYVVSNSTNEVAIIDTATDTVDKVIPVPGARSTIGVAHDEQTNRIFVAAQGTDNLIILDAETGAVVHDIPVGAGALNVAFNPTSRRAYVSNRGASTITVVNPDTGAIVANLGPAPLANHVTADGRGGVYAVTKSGGEGATNNDSIMHITPRN